ncbi:MAG: hypothetical protein QF749_01875 [Verrucomicrobiota bacterium]|jgi:hypothetical protein|nr:hypothetical protein [Verrucomicrobiota bacterium]MDP7177015.1 hypothetical protein [Verrucomicrobiota bacterium]MDP7291109.1 hypothetical protein [Verrucomicrobiota bacterium]MDP7585407.1 hypothetical protein [Verrucomicrobiota bacterium]|tara:strand:+ start:8108 stop:8791 length:684 start_codon:yes stop_codon:yes gene_type:complete
MRFSRFIGGSLAALAIGVCPLRAGELALKVGQKAPPEEISQEVAKALGKRCIQLLDRDQPVFEFWFRAPVPLKKKPATAGKGLEAVAMATLIGVVRIHKLLTDYRDDELYEGVFTMRYGSIPSDGDHLDASEYPYFAVLIPAKKDRTLAGIKTYKAMTKASLKETDSEHPMILSLRPVRKPAVKIPAFLVPAPNHKSVLLKTTGQVAGTKQTTDILLQVVYEGEGEF